MSETLCIARAYDDAPLCRTVVGVYRRLVYIAEPSTRVAGELRGKGAVGFNHEFVFEFDNALFDRLSDAYRRDDRFALGALWGQATKIPEVVLDTFLKTST
jgi:hypothetical protein